jgi:hypothetical protein
MRLKQVRQHHAQSSSVNRHRNSHENGSDEYDGQHGGADLSASAANGETNLSCANTITNLAAINLPAVGALAAMTGVCLLSMSLSVISVRSASD